MVSKNKHKINWQHFAVKIKKTTMIVNKAKVYKYGICNSFHYFGELTLCIFIKIYLHLFDLFWTISFKNSFKMFLKTYCTVNWVTNR